MSKTIDCRGLACPKPVIMTKKELEALESGDVITIVDNDIARQNLQKLAESMGFSSSWEKKEYAFEVTITKCGDCRVMEFNGKDLVILIGTDKLGRGDDRLGEALMKSYMFALSEADVLPKAILFLNSGVKLTTEGSQVLESLESISKKGVDILSCGTCLDFYGLKDKLVIGTATNMYTIVDKLNRASNTITL